MPVFGNTINAQSSFPQISRWVEVQQHWDDGWQYVPYLSPVECSRTVAPQIGQATLQYEFGAIKPEDSPFFNQYFPYDFQDWYVRIVIQQPFCLPQAVWYGIIVDTENQYDSSQQLMGTQTFTCAELAYILNRQSIYGASANKTPGSTDPVQFLNDTPTFNERHWKGNDILGNRSSDTREVNFNDTYVFEPNGEVWSYLDIVNYLLTVIPLAFDIPIIGQYKALDDIEDVFEIGNKTCWECLCKLIDNHRGFGFNIIVDEFTDTPYLNVFTLTDFDISIGSVNLPGNPNQVAFIYPSVYPFTHMTGDVPFRTTAANTFDRLVVEGQRVKVMASFSYKDSTLVEGWENAQQNDYVTALGNDQVANDRARSGDTYENVFTKHIVPKNWNWQVGAGDASIPVNINVVPVTDNAGNVGFPVKPTDGFWNGQNHFERTLPMEAGKDYTQNPPTNNNPEDDEPDFVPTMAMIYDDANGPYHQADNKWHFVHKLSAAFPGVSDMHVHNLDNELGVKITCHPNHLLALTQWAGAGESAYLPEFNYHNLLVTGFFKTWQRQQIVLQSYFPTENLKTKVLRVPNAEYWVTAESAAIGIDDNGALKRYNVANGIFRNDIKLLQSVAATAGAWYFVERQAVSIPIKSLGLYVQLGTFLEAIVSFTGVEQVRTPVSSLRMDFRNNTTTIATAYNDLDFVGFARKFKDA